MWLWNLVKAYGMIEYAQARYASLEAASKKWDKKKTFQENVDNEVRGRGRRARGAQAGGAGSERSEHAIGCMSSGAGGGRRTDTGPSRRRRQSTHPPTPFARAQYWHFNPGRSYDPTIDYKPLQKHFWLAKCWNHGLVSSTLTTFNRTAPA
jgi:hypothetical protein